MNNVLSFFDMSVLSVCCGNNHRSSINNNKAWQTISTRANYIQTDNGVSEKLYTEGIMASLQPCSSYQKRQNQILSLVKRIIPSLIRRNTYM